MARITMQTLKGTTTAQVAGMNTADAADDRFEVRNVYETVTYEVPDGFDPSTVTAADLRRNPGNLGARQLTAQEYVDLDRDGALTRGSETLVSVGTVNVTQPMQGATTWVGGVGVSLQRVDETNMGVFDVNNPPGQDALSNVSALHDSGLTMFASGASVLSVQAALWQAAVEHYQGRGFTNQQVWDFAMRDFTAATTGQRTYATIDNALVAGRDVGQKTQQMAAAIFNLLPSGEDGLFYDPAANAFGMHDMMNDGENNLLVHMNFYAAMTYCGDDANALLGGVYHEAVDGRGQPTWEARADILAAVAGVGIGNRADGARAAGGNPMLFTATLIGFLAHGEADAATAANAIGVPADLATAYNAEAQRVWRETSAAWGSLRGMLPVIDAGTFAIDALVDAALRLAGR